MLDIFALLVLFQIKHFACDYPLQTPYMLGKFKKEGWILPLLSHSGVHAITTLMLSYAFTGDLLFSVGLGILDLVIHFVVDRLKAHPSIGGRYTTDNPKFWWCLGADQMAHHLTHYMFVYLIVTH